MRYSRNRIYIPETEQEMIKNFPIVLGGGGIGSVIAECALRFGFETITIIDGDQIELSNLNRQNYAESDIALDKVEALKQRLKAINCEANITCYPEYITEDNIEFLLNGHGVAINALDFTTDIPLKFDKLCQDKEIPVLHPYNLGWAGLVAVITPDGLGLDTIAKEGEPFNELDVVEYALGFSKFWGKPYDWIEEIVKEYKREEYILPPPQLSVASWMVAAMCTTILYKIATKKTVKQFPDFYLSSTID